MEEKIDNRKTKMLNASELLMDQDVEKILLGTYKQSRSIPEMSDACGIPLVVCYRKVSKLVELGLLKTDKTMSTKAGKTINFYEANIDDAFIFYRNGKIKVRFRIVLQMASDLRNRLNYVAKIGELQVLVHPEGNQL